MVSLLPSGVCTKSCGLCVPRAAPSSWAWSCGCWWPWTGLARGTGSVTSQQHSCSLECLLVGHFPRYLSSAVFWHLLLHLHPLVSAGPPRTASAAVSEVSPIQNSSPALLSVLQEHPVPRCLEPFTWQQLAVPWQVLELSFEIFTELAASIYCSLRSCFCMFNRSVTGNRVMGSLISLVPPYVLSPVKRRAGIRFAVCPAGSALISQDLWVFLPQISPWGKRGWDLPRHHRSPLAQITAALPGTARKLLGKLAQLNCNLRGFSEYLNVLLLQFGENLIFHI